MACEVLENDADYFRMAIIDGQPWLRKLIYLIIETIRGKRSSWDDLRSKDVRQGYRNYLDNQGPAEL
jgi:hypothetical protein